VDVVGLIGYLVSHRRVRATLGRFPWVFMRRVLVRSFCNLPCQHKDRKAGEGKAIREFVRWWPGKLFGQERAFRCLDWVWGEVIE